MPGGSVEDTAVEVQKILNDESVRSQPFSPSLI